MLIDEPYRQGAVALLEEDWKLSWIEGKVLDHNFMSHNGPSFLQTKPDKMSNV